MPLDSATPAAAPPATPPPAPTGAGAKPDVSFLDPNAVFERMRTERAAGQAEADTDLAAARAAAAKVAETAPQPTATPANVQWGSLAMAIAALGGLLTKTPVATAANAMAGVLNAYHQGDLEKSKEEYQRWKDAHDAAGKMLDLELKSYDAAIKKMESAPREAVAELTAQTHAFQNTILMSYLNGGKVPEAIAHIAGMQKLIGSFKQTSEDVAASHDTMTTIIGNWQSGDPGKQADALDLLSKTLGGEATKASRQATTMNQMRLQTDAAKLRSGDPAQIADAQKDMSTFAGMGSAFLRGTPAATAGSTGSEKTAVQAGVRRDHPDWPEDKIVLEADRRLKEGTVEADIDLSPDAIDTDARLYLLTGQMPSLGFGNAGTIQRARIAIQNRAGELAHAQGSSVADILAGRAEFKADTSSLAQLSKMADSAISFENTALANMKIVEQLMDAGAGTDAGPVINRWLQAGKVATGDPDVAAFNAAIMTAATEYAKVMSGSTGSQGSTDSARAEAQAIVSKLFSKAQIEATFNDTMRPDMENRKKSLEKQRAAIADRIRDIPATGNTKAAPATEELPPQARAQLQKGHDTTFANGQVWTLDDSGNPKRVR
jgi:hypothetical protein